MSAVPYYRAKTPLGLVLAFVAGVLFAVGLALSGMTQPAKVIAFLDVAGRWDPSLAFVMVGAIFVYALANVLVRRRSAPFLGDGFHLPTRRDLEPSLLFGAGLFGVGWGLVGYCPGPAVAVLATGSRDALLFVGAMAGGMFGFEWLQKQRTRTASQQA